MRLSRRMFGFGVLVVLAFFCVPAVLQAETANYDPTLTAPRCITGAAPCEVPSSLIGGRDTVTGIIEQNAPNTLLSSPCADGIIATTLEALNSFTVKDLTDGTFSANDNLQVIARVNCRHTSSTGDWLHVFYKNDISSPTWDYVGGTFCNAVGPQYLSVNFILGASPYVNQAIRVAFLHGVTNSPPPAACVGGSNTLHDRDDLALKVGNSCPGDLDCDGMPDAWEQSYGCLQPTTPDANMNPDGDAYTNIQEYNNGTDPCYVYNCLNDYDCDNMPNSWEQLYTACGLDPNYADAGMDPELDGFTNLEEYNYSTDPCTLTADTDLDGLPDSYENSIGTNPKDPDSDDDLLWDGEEVNLYGTSPTQKDSDNGGSGKWDGVEVYFCGTSPNAPGDDGNCALADADQDGLDASLDYDDFDRDVDDDGLLDGQDYYWFPSRADLAFDYDGGGTGDGAELMVDFTDPEFSGDDLFPPAAAQAGANWLWDLDGDHRATLIDKLLLKDYLDGGYLAFAQVNPDTITLMDLNGDGVVGGDTADVRLFDRLLAGDLSPKGGEPTAFQAITLSGGTLAPGGPSQTLQMTLGDANGTPRNGAGILFEVTYTSAGINFGDVGFGSPLAVSGQPAGDGVASTSVWIAGGVPNGTIKVRARMPATSAKGLSEVQSSQVTFMVQGLSVTAIDIQPNTGATVNEGSSLPFRAVCTWGDSSTTDCTGSTTWMVTVGSGWINSSGIYTPGPISGCADVLETVEGTNSGYSDFTDVSVLHDNPITALDIQPDSLVLNEGEASQLTAECTRQCPPTGPEDCSGQINWGPVTGPGSVSAAGWFTAGTIAGCTLGEATVQAVHQVFTGVSGSETITINNTDNSVFAVLIHPRGASIAEGATLQFGMTCDWQCGPDTDCSASAGWDASGEGWIDANGLFTAYQVTQNSTVLVMGTHPPTGPSSNTMITVINVPVDTDGDGLEDYQETGCLSSADPDSDDDGLCDGGGAGDETCIAGEDRNNDGTMGQGETDPCNADVDGDGLNDYQEICYDGNCNAYTMGADTNPFSADTDGDFIGDALEVALGCPGAAVMPDTDNDGLGDGAEDADHDGVVDSNETDPCNPDTDGDDLWDGVEFSYNANPLKYDTDGDGLSDGEEALIYFTLANDTDSDNGGVDDYTEVRRGTDPNAAGDDGCAGGYPEPTQDDHRLDQGPGSTNAQGPAVGADGQGELVVVWEDSRGGANLDIYGRLIQGNTLEGNDFQIDQSTGSASQPAAVFSAKYMVVWQDTRNGGSDIYGRTYLPVGSPALSDEFTVDVSPGSATGPRVVAVSSSRNLISWVNDQNSLWSRDCSVSFSCGLATQLASGSSLENHDSFSYQDNFAYLAWEQAGNIRIQKFGSSGNPVSTARVLTALAGQAHRPALACNAMNRCLVAWEDTRRGGPTVDLYAIMYDVAAGETVSLEFWVDNASATTKQSSAPDVAVNSDGSFWVVWQDNRYGDFDIFGRRYDSLGAAQTCEFPVDRGGTAAARRPALARAGNSMSVVWQDNRNPSAGWDIFSNRFGGSTKRIYLTLPSGDLNPGQEFWVSIYASTGSTSLGYYLVTLTYDPNLLEFVYPPEPMPGSTAFNIPWFQQYGTGELNLWANNMAAGSCTTAGDIHLADVLFRLSFNAPMGLNTYLDLKNTGDYSRFGIYDCSWMDRTNLFGTAGVMVQTAMPCATYGADQFMDCNGDGSLNYQDVTTARKLVEGAFINTSGACFTNVGGLQCDINGNGYIDENDVGFLESFIRADFLFSGENGVCESTASGDDVQEIAAGQSSDCAVCVTAGDLVLATDPALESDDTVFNTLITSGSDGICDTTASFPDVQTTPVGEGCFGAVCITAGDNGVIGSATSGDDYVIDMDLNLAELCSCVAAGDSTLATSLSDDDIVNVVDQVIMPGPDGVCDSAAVSPDTQVTPVGKSTITLPGSPRSIELVDPPYSPYYVDVYTEDRVSITVNIKDENGMPRCGISPVFEVISGDAIFETSWSNVVQGIPSCSGVGVTGKPSGEVTVSLIPGAMTSTIRVSIPNYFRKCVASVPPLEFEIVPITYQPPPDFLCASAVQSGSGNLGDEVNVDIYLAGHLSAGGTETGIVGRSQYLQVLTSRNYAAGSSFGTIGQTGGDMAFYDGFEEGLNWSIPLEFSPLLTRVSSGGTVGFFQGSWAVRAYFQGISPPYYMTKKITGLDAYDNLMVGLHANGGMSGSGEIAIEAAPPMVGTCPLLSAQYMEIARYTIVPGWADATMASPQDPVPFLQNLAGIPEVCVRVAFYPAQFGMELFLEDIYVFGQKALFKEAFDGLSLGQYPSSFNTPASQGPNPSVVVMPSPSGGNMVKMSRTLAGSTVDKYYLEKHLDLANLSDARLQFQVKDGGLFQNDWTLEPAHSFAVEVNDSKGYGQWIEIWRMDWQATSWEQVEIYLSGDWRYALVGDSATPGDEFRIRFVASMNSTAGGGDPDAVYLDDVQVLGNPGIGDHFQTITDLGNGHYSTSIKTFTPTFAAGSTIMQPTQVIATYLGPDGMFLDSTWYCAPPPLQFIPRKVANDPAGLFGAASPHVWPDTFTVNACKTMLFSVLGRYQDSPPWQWEDLTHLFTFSVDGPATITEDGWLQADCFRSTDSLGITVNAIPRYPEILDPGGSGGGQQTGYLSGKIMHTYPPYAGVVSSSVTTSGETSISGTTLSDGSYSFQDVPVGTYTLKAMKLNYKGKTENGIVVEENETTTKNVYQPTGSDTDGDTTANSSDTDDDNDGKLDSNETGGLSKDDPDTDDDGYLDNTDAFPTNANEHADNDGDTTGDNADTDDDNDSLLDTEETAVGSDGYITDKNDSDSDNDGLNDGAEYTNHTNPNNTDSDGDKLNDYLEAVTVTCLMPNTVDTDGDGLRDGDTNSVGEDLDHDGVLDAGETNPCVADTDGDGLNDYKEVVTRPCLDPRSTDTDGDGLADGAEDADHDAAVDAGETDPCDTDTDDDGVDDYKEEVTKACMDPRDTDTDNDGLLDGTGSGEDKDGDGVLDAGETDPCDTDTDDDGVDDYKEEVTRACMDPRSTDTDGDGLADGAEDADHDAAVDSGETDPCSEDTDGDLMPDDYEVSDAACLEATTADALADGDTDDLENIHEYFNGSDPCDDSDAQLGAAGGGYFGDADGDLVIGVPDLNRLNLRLNSRSADYSNAFPADQLIQDMDGDLVIGIPDKNLLSLILNGRGTDYVAGSPTLLTNVQPGSTVPSLSVGDTVRIRVKLTKDGDKQRAGFGVVFSVASGTATLYGGEGAPVSPSGARYDLTDLEGDAEIVVKATGTGTIYIHVELPYDSEVHTRNVVLSSNVQINVP